MGSLISFPAALKKMGTAREQAEVLDLTTRSITEYHAGRIPRFGRLLLRHPELLEALLEDARAGRSNGNHENETQNASTP